MALTRGELWRKLVHVAAGALAFLLRDLPWWAAVAMAAWAALFSCWILPRLGGLGLRRDSEIAGLTHGIQLYPAAVLALVVAFPGERRWMAAALWALLACGDGMAALVGRTVAGPRLPWNDAKTWSGSLGYVLFGAAAASLLAGWTLGLPAAAALSPRMLGVTLPLAGLCALVESAPTTLDDNLTVPLAGALLLPLLAEADWRLLADRLTGEAVAGALLAAGAVAVVARLAGALDDAGAASALLIGAMAVLGIGQVGLAMLLVFAASASGATRHGFRGKAVRGLAEERGGRRGWRHAWANGGVAALLALLAGASSGETRSLLVLAFAASLAAGAADTCSSEVGKAFGRATVSLASLRAVPAGSVGGVSAVGTSAGALAAAVVAVVGTALDLYPARAALLVAAAGTLGSLAESLVGAAAERRGWLGHHLRNVFNTAVGAWLAMGLARLVPAASSTTAVQ
jgi:uncharacterized protein (TIGR00297 family)